MSEETCTHNCETCSAACSKKGKPESFLKKQNDYSNIKNVIGIVSGKGGVGKSLVTALAAVSARRLGYETAVLDADITGPSIPHIFGLKDKAVGTQEGILPELTKTGIKVMSVNLLLEDDTQPVIWRGPVIAGTVKQFWTDVVWGEVDYMFTDMPPGTGDVPLTVFQSLPINGIIIVTSPQELVSMIVGKAVRMAKLMNIPVLGIIENMSYAVCPDCGKHIDIFGESKTEDVAKLHDIPFLGRIPFDPKLVAACDAGTIELFDETRFDAGLDKIFS